MEIVAVCELWYLVLVRDEPRKLLTVVNIESNSVHTTGKLVEALKSRGNKRERSVKSV